MKRLLTSIRIMTLALLVMPSALSANWLIKGGYSYEQGDYGSDEDLEVSILSLDLGYFADVWGFSVYLPYISVTGAVTFVPTSTNQGPGRGSGFGSGSTGSSTTSSESVTRSGLGDVSLSISRAFFPARQGGFFHEITASIKLPTASESDNLGNGETDYSLELFSSVDHGNWTPSFSLGYQINGDPAGSDLNDIWFYTLGTRYAISRNTGLNVAYDFSQALADGLADSESVSLVLDWQWPEGTTLGVELNSGLSDANADTSMMISLSKRY
ncbi:MAG: transporter [Gammaproteobacteria bacterium]|nr:transporter [Gammaproteobacteria bacterium]